MMWSTWRTCGKTRDGLPPNRPHERTTPWSGPAGAFGKARGGPHGRQDPVSGGQGKPRHNCCNGIRSGVPSPNGAILSLNVSNRHCHGRIGTEVSESPESSRRREIFSFGPA
jgi:hypothetical protein